MIVSPRSGVTPPTLPAGHQLAELDDAADREHILDLDRWAFVLEPAVEDEGQHIWTLEPGRSVGVWDERGAQRRLVAVHSSFAFRLPVPGGHHLPAAGLTWVAVHPGHRRRGLARAMVTAHVARSRDRGEVLSALYAAEMGIYGRYGYGVATRSVRMMVPRGSVLREVDAAADLTVELDTLDAGRHGAAIDAVHRAVERPGWIPRESDALRDRQLLDLPSERRGAERLRVALVRDEAGAGRGYALFRRQTGFSPSGTPTGVVHVREAVSLDAAAARALWGTLLDLDLMATVETPSLPVDDPLVHQLVDLRAAEPRLLDGIWIRLLDVPAALAARTYAAPVDVVLEVADALVPANAGRWRLRVGVTGEAEVTRTDEPAELALDVATLAEAYLGTTSLAALAAAGRVRTPVPGSLLPAATAFSWPLAPATSWGF